MIQTRAQKDLKLAADLVGEVEKQTEVRRIYGGLCHSFPVMVRTCGLCQALAFSQDKAAETKGPATSRNRAYQLLLKHVGRVLEVADPATAVRGQDAFDYIRSTRRVMEAWVYFKRFAVSILKVDSSRAAEEGLDAD